MIRFTSLPSDTCSLSSSVCAVEEGQRVRVNCTAHSNPAINTVAWQSGTSSVLDRQADRDMGMNYTCDVSTINGDSRLPLHTSQQIEILVKCTCLSTTSCNERRCKAKQRQTSQGCIKEIRTIKTQHVKRYTGRH